MKVIQPPVGGGWDYDVNQDITFKGVYQVTNLAAPAAGEALRKGNADITNAEIAAAAAIAYSKLALTGQLLNADIAAAAAIAYSKLVLTGQIVDADIAAAAAIALTKLAAGRFGMDRMPAGTSGLVLTAQGAGVDPAYASVGGDYPKQIKPALTRWVCPGWYAAATLNSLTTAGRIYYVPIFVGETKTFIRIGIYVNLAGTGTADLRIFNWNNGLPGSLVLSAGTVDVTTTGYKEITISQQLTRGYYFLAVRCSGAPTLEGFDVAQAITAPVGGLVTTGATRPWLCIMRADAAYADPAPAPDGVDTPAFAFVKLREA